MAKLIHVGFFRELAHGEPTGPSLLEERAATPDPDEARIVAYLKAGELFVGSPGVVRDVLDGSAGIIGSPEILTDGLFAWPADFAYYVERYHVRPPALFHEHMARSQWRVPSDIAVEHLEF